MVDKKQTDQDQKALPSYMEGFDASKVKKASEVEILPTISVSQEGLEYAKVIKVLSEPRKIELPAGKQKFGKYAYPMEIEFNGIKAQIYCTGALRFNVGVIDEKLGSESVVGHTIRVWKEIGQTAFGEQLMYKASLVE